MPDSAYRHLMQQIADLPHGKIKRFANAVKGKLYMSSPNEADFINAIFEAAAAIAKEESDESDEE